MANWSENAVTILNARYLLKDKTGKVIESPDDMLKRVARFVASKEKDKELWEKKFLEIMDTLEFLPNSPTLMNSGKPNAQLSACFLLDISDDLANIFEQVKQSALIAKSGGGCGLLFSNIRPAGSLVNTTSGVASGPVSFLKAFDAASGAVKQGGVRRGAGIGILSINHPDIIEFVTCKEDINNFQNFNISVTVTDNFIKAIYAGSKFPLKNPKTKEVTYINAKKLFDIIVHQAWLTGEPGMLFIDTINAKNPTPWLGNLSGTNPCIVGDSFVHTTRGKIKIKDLVGTNPWVFCSDGKNVQYRQANNIRLTGNKKEVWKLRYDDGTKHHTQEIVATPEHLIMTFDGKYKMLKDLSIGESIMPFYQHKRNSKGYRQIQDRDRSIGEAHFVLEKKIGRQLEKGEIPHHIDEDKTNNDPDNIELKSQHDHDREKMLGAKNPIHKMILEGRSAFHRPGFTSEMNVITWKNPETREKRILGIKRAKKKDFHNHRVISIEFYGYEDVYNMEIPDYNNFAVNGIIVHNCGEQPLLPYESCNLGSIDISKFVKGRTIDWNRLSDVVETAVRFLDDIIEVNSFPNVKIERKTKQTRKVGLGIMGFADALILLGHKYGDDKSLKLAKRIMMNIRETAHMTSRDLGKEKGFCQPKLKRRNACLTTIAPTGSISMIADCSSGIEPLFAKNFTKRVMGNIDLKMGKKYKDIDENDIVIASEIPFEKHIEMQAALQEYTDNAVSKTVNLANTATEDDVRKAFLLAHSLGCKGITLYRDGSRDAPLKKVEQGLSECESGKCML